MFTDRKPLSIKSPKNKIKLQSPKKIQRKHQSQNDINY
jgi:hypothetical protein